MRFPPRLATLLLIVAVTMGAMWTMLLAGGSGSLESGTVRVVYDWMAATALIPWLVVAVFRPSWRPSSRLLPALAAIVAAFAISTTTSRFPRLSLEMLGYGILLVLLYLLVVTLMRRPEIRAHFERLTLIVCLLVCCLYLLQVLQVWLNWWALVGRLAIPPLRPAYLGLSLGSPNPLATLVLVLAAFAVATNNLLPSLVGRLLVAIVLGLVVVTTVITGSRGAWLGAAVGVAGTAGIAMIARPGSRRSAMHLVRSRWGAVGVAIGAPLVVVASAVVVLSGRLAPDDGGARGAFARASLQMFQSSPLTGVGPGTWGVLRASNTASTDIDYYIPHAHNLYVQTVAEFGVVGIAAAVVLVGFLAALIGGAMRGDDSGRRRVGYAAAFGLLLLGAQQLVDVLVNVPALMLAIGLPIAWLDATAQDSPAAARLVRSRAIPLALSLITCITIAGLARIESTAKVATRADVAASEGSWQAASSLFADAVATDPGENLYQFELGVSAANAGDLGLAEAALSVSAVADDYTYAWLDLAAVRWQIGDASGARTALDRAERLGLGRTPVALAAGWLRQQLGDDDLATADYARAILQTPTLAADAFWSSSVGPSGGLPSILAKADTLGLPADLLRIDLILDRLDDAQEEIAAAGPSDPELYQNVIAAWLGDQAAWEAMQDLAARRPLDPEPVAWCRFVAAHLGDDAAIRKYGSWAQTLVYSDHNLPLVGRITFGSAKPLPPHILDRYGSIYRRDMIAAQVVSLLPQIEWRDRS